MEFWFLINFKFIWIFPIPPHGGTDNGASGNDIIEKNMTLAISKIMYNELKRLGIPVYITRETDETLSPTQRVNRIKNAFGNDSNVIVVSNHINAGGGEFTFHYIIWLSVKTSVLNDWAR